MAATARCCFVLLILGTSIRVDGLWNFRADGEYLTVDTEDCSKPYNVDSTRYFEEVHFTDEASIDKTALRIDAGADDPTSFFIDLKGQKGFLQLGDEDCQKLTNGEDMPPFKILKFESEAVYSPVYLAMTELRYLVINDSMVNVNERGLPAVRAQLNLTDKSDSQNYVETAYVTFKEQKDGDYEYDNLVPLSIELCTVNNGRKTIERLSIVEFTWNSTVEEDASPGGGVRCDDYGRSVDTTIFDASTLILRTEQTVEGNVTSGDTVLDFDRSLVRVDNGVDDYFLSTSQQLIYKVANPDSRSQKCERLDASTAPKLNWTFVEFSAKSAKDFFGVNDTFKIKTRTTRRGIECDLISGIRDYFPEKANNTPAVWEWCVGEIDTGDGLRKYMVNLDVSIRPVGGPLYQESYSLYDVERNVDKTKLYVDYFTELEPCFTLTGKLNLQVTVDGQESYSEEDVQNAVESGLFKAAVLDALLQKSDVNPDTYRFGSTKAYLVGPKEAVFQFWLLDAPENAAESDRLDGTRKKLQDAISESALPVNVGEKQFSIRKDSLTAAKDIAQDTTTTSPVTQTEPAESTTSDAGTTTEESGNDLPKVDVGHQAALVWGVAFAVLLVGGGVGYAAGSKLLVH